MQANVFCITKDISRDEWLEKRRHGIGGSDAAIIMGVSPFSSLMDLWLDKTGQFEANEDDASEAMYWGNVLEDVAPVSSRSALVSEFVGAMPFCSILIILICLLT